MKHAGLFYGELLVAIIGVLLAIFYAIPGITHPLVANPQTAHYKPVALFAAIAILVVVVALVSRPKITR